MKILLVISSLESGGAETHVCSLAAALTAKGHKVAVAAESGRLCAEIESCGASFFALTEVNRSVKGSFKTLSEMKKIIRSFRPDIVHAHTRITAFICGILHKRHKFRLVVTTHALYQRNRIYDRASVWGDRTVAVSEDIKGSLISDFSLTAEKITVIGNGVDTELFSPKDIGGEEEDATCLFGQELSARSCESLLFGKSRNGRSINVVFVSRLDSDCSLTAELICFIAPNIAAFYPNVSFHIVGGGSELERIRRLADDANAKLGLTGRNIPAVNVLGDCDDVATVLKEADIFVGVSRAALEAMSCDVPVILSGNEGYLGILNGDKLPDAEKSNFCCRNNPLPTSDRLYADIMSLCRMTEEGGESLKSLKMREYVKQNHSISDMAKRTEEVYRSAMAERRILIGGYYGYGNAGDDSVLTSMLEMLPKKYVTVLAHNPRLSERHYGVRCASRFNPFSVIHEMRRADVFVSGGGALLQDLSGKRSLNYYLALLRLSRKCSAKTVVYANGIGPLKSLRSRKKVAKVLQNADYISLRSEEELAFLESIGVDHTKLSVSADPAILTEKSPDFPKIDGSFAVVALRDGCLPDSKICSALDRVCDNFNVTPVFLPMQPSADLDVSRRVRDEMNRGVVLVGLTPSMTVSLLERARFALTMRMHLLVFSSCASIPALGISDDPKLSSFAEYSNHPRVICADNFSEYALDTAIQALMEKREDYVKALSERRGVLTELAKNDISNI